MATSTAMNAAIKEGRVSRTAMIPVRCGLISLLSALQRPEGKRVKRSSRSPFSWMIDVTGSGGGATRRNKPFLWATAEG